MENNQTVLLVNYTFKNSYNIILNINKLYTTEIVCILPARIFFNSNLNRKTNSFINRPTDLYTHYIYEPTDEQFTEILNQHKLYYF